MFSDSDTSGRWYFRIKDLIGFLKIYYYNTKLKIINTLIVNG